MGNVPVSGVFGADPDLRPDLHPGSLARTIRQERRGTLRWLVHPPRHRPPPPRAAGRTRGREIALRGPRGRLAATRWGGDGDPVVLYVHGHSRSRWDALCLVDHALSLGLAVVALDCSGSGQSEGSCVSWGLWEADDVEAALAALPPPACLWGADMGAVACMRCLQASPREVQLVVEDPFEDLPGLCGDRMRAAGLPAAAHRALYLDMRRLVLADCGFDLDKAGLDPRSPVPCRHMHVVVSDRHEVVAPHHGERLARRHRPRSTLERHHQPAGEPPPVSLIRRLLRAAA